MRKLALVGGHRDHDRLRIQRPDGGREVRIVTKGTNGQPMQFEPAF